MILNMMGVDWAKVAAEPSRLMAPNPVKGVLQKLKLEYFLSMILLMWERMMEPGLLTTDHRRSLMVNSAK